jgi:hypothetical protein
MAMQQQQIPTGCRVVSIRHRAFEARASESFDEHYARAQRIGWNGPPDVLEALFGGLSQGVLSAGARFPALDWTTIRWTECVLAPDEVEALHVERTAQVLVDELRRRVQASGEEMLRGERLGGLRSVLGTLRPVVLDGGCIDAPGARELIAGFAVVGRWLGIVDRSMGPLGKLPVWIGIASRE